MKETNKPMYARNLKTSHREWNELSVIELRGKDHKQFMCTIKGVGRARVFCICDTMSPETSYVLLDREVLIQYEDETCHLIPACLLVPTQADNWRNLMDETSRYNSWEGLFDNPPTNSDPPAGSVDDEVPTGDEGATSENSENQEC